MSDPGSSVNRGLQAVRHLALVIGTLLVVPTAVAAQEGPLLLGKTVRLTSPTPGIGLRSGVVRSINRDTLWLREEGSSTDLAISTESLQQLFIADGWRHHTGKGAVFGLLAGGVLGGAIGSTTRFCIFSSCQPATSPGVLIGAPVGLLVGTVVGTAIRTRRWRSVAVPLYRGGLRLEIGTEGPAASLSWTP